MKALNFNNFSTLKITNVKKNILQVTLNRPEVYNALNTVMMKELLDLWKWLGLNQSDYRCIILTGSGDKAFCAGADLKERNGMSVSQWMEQHAILEQAMREMVECQTPIISSVNGVAFGGGLELMLASDFSYSIEKAKFAFPEPKLGIIPGAMGTQWLPRVVGIKRAKEICFSCETFDAKIAEKWGIINSVFTNKQDLDKAVLNIAMKISKNAPIAIRQVKKSLSATLNMGLKAGYAFEIEAYNQCINTKDREEGVLAFNEKRKPNFKGI